MAWQAADPGTIAQDAQGNYHVKVGADWVPAPKGTIAQDDAGKFHYNTDAFAPPTPPTPSPAAAPSPGLGSQLLDKAKDVAGTVAKGAGAVGDVVHRAYQTLSGDTPTPYEDPLSFNQRFAAPFEHNPNSTPDIDRAAQAALSIIPGGRVVQASAPVVRTVANAADTALKNSGPLGETVSQDVLPPVSDIASGAATLEGAGRVIGRSPIGAMANTAGRTLKGAGVLATTLDPEVAANAALSPTVEQAATIQSNPAIERARQAGYKLTGADVRRAVNGPNSDVPGLTRSRMTDSGTTERIQQDNQALTTQGLAQDVGLKNTRAIDPDEVAARIKEEGQTYDRLGKAVGRVTEPTTELSAALDRAAAPGASATSRDAVEQQIQFYRDQYENGFNGPEAINDVRHLRQNATRQMASLDPDVQALGRTNQNIANAIEDELMRNVPPDQASLRTEFPASRTQLAKLFELQEATQNGQVSAQKLAQLRRGGAPLSGAADEAAHAADLAPESTSPTITPAVPHVGVGHYGVLRTAVNVGGRMVRSLPGMDESAEAFQRENYGPFREPTPPTASTASAPEPYSPPPERIPEALRVGQGAASPTRTPTMSGPSGYSDLATESRTLGDEFALGANRTATPAPSSVRSGPSNYARQLIELTPAQRAEFDRKAADALKQITGGRY